jgi:hypothetical protein
MAGVSIQVYSNSTAITAVILIIAQCPVDVTKKYKVAFYIFIYFKKWHLKGIPKAKTIMFKQLFFHTQIY